MKKISVVMALFVLGMACGRAQADPCDKDRVTVCNDTTAGDGRVHDCLIGRKDKITPACAEALDRADVLAAGVKQACAPEVQRWCAQYTGEGRNAVLNCLKYNKNQVGDACKHKYRQYKAFGFDVQS